MTRQTIRRAHPHTAAILAGLLLPVLLTGCGPSAKVGSGSPVVTGQTVAVSNNGTEASQKVTVTLTFDRAVKLDKAVSNELAVTLNGDAVNTKTMRWAATAGKDANDKLVFTLSAQPTVTDPSGGNYFAVYEGKLAIAAKNGASVPAVTDAGGTYAAKWTKVRVQIPSGVDVTAVSSGKGSASTPAQATVRVTSIGVVRAMTWVQFLKNGQPVMAKDYKKGSFSYINDGSFPIHDHTFLQMRAKDYAQEIAEGLESYFGKGTPTEGQYAFSSESDTVTVKATAPAENEELSLQIFNRPAS